MIQTDVRKLAQAVLLVVLCLIFYANKKPLPANPASTESPRDGQSVNTISVKSKPAKAG